MTGALVVSLFQRCRPTAIAGSVIAGGIRPAIERLPWRPFAHVLQKRFKAIQPAITNSDAASAVILKTNCFWVQATSLHALPDPVNRAFSTPMFQIVNMTELGASAAASCDLKQIAAQNSSLSSAGALAQPIASAFLRMRKAQDCQKAKALSCDIQPSGHDGSSTERLCQEMARRFSGGLSRYSNLKWSC